MSNPKHVCDKQKTTSTKNNADFDILYILNNKFKNRDIKKAFDQHGGGGRSQQHCQCHKKLTRLWRNRPSFSFFGLSIYFYGKIRCFAFSNFFCAIGQTNKILVFCKQQLLTRFIKMIYTLFIYNRLGDCIYYQEWHRKKSAPNQKEEFKLIYGLIFSMKAFIAKSSPVYVLRAQKTSKEINTY